MGDELSEQRRILIWCITRSLSTVLVRSLSELPNSQCHLEQFCSAANFGPERRSPIESELLEPELSFQFVKKLYEGPWAGKSVVVGKEMPYALIGKYNAIPAGYQHVFLIRHPAKALRSFVRRLSAVDEYQREFYLGLNQFKHLSQMHRYVTETLVKRAVVIDADDLASRPAETLRIFCQATGIPFTEKLLQWDQLSGPPDNWSMAETMWKDHEKTGWFDAVLNSTGFVAPSESSRMGKEGVLLPEFEKMIEEALPYYEEIHRLRIRL